MEELAIEELKQKHRWHRTQVEYGVRANFCCEYCGRDMLASVDSYAMWARDHIVPQKAKLPL